MWHIYLDNIFGVDVTFIFNILTIQKYLLSVLLLWILDVTPKTETDQSTRAEDTKTTQRMYHMYIFINVLLTLTNNQRGRRGHDRMAVWFVATCTISAYHH